MDPYLERRWGDVHVGLIAGISAILQPNLPAGLQAIGQEEIVTDLDPRSNRLEQFGGDRTDPAGSSDRVATIAPIIVRLVLAEQVRRWIEIIDLDDGDRVVTAIEVLSPSNKAAGRGNLEYRRKIEDYGSAGVNIVEIDLLRTSRARLLIPGVDHERGRSAAYFTCVNRARDPERWEVYPMPLRVPLPTVPVPCRPGERDVPLPLQSVVNRIYEEGGHYHTKYARPLDRPLSPADAAWAAERIALSAGGTPPESKGLAEA